MSKYVTLTRQELAEKYGLDPKNKNFKRLIINHLQNDGYIFDWSPQKIKLISKTDQEIDDYIDLLDRKFGIQINIHTDKDNIKRVLILIYCMNIIQDFYFMPGSLKCRYLAYHYPDYFHLDCQKNISESYCYKNEFRNAWDRVKSSCYYTEKDDWKFWQFENKNNMTYITECDEFIVRAYRLSIQRMKELTKDKQYSFNELMRQTNGRNIAARRWKGIKWNEGDQKAIVDIFQKYGISLITDNRLDLGECPENYPMHKHEVLNTFTEEEVKEDIERNEKAMQQYINSFSINNHVGE